MECEKKLSEKINQNLDKSCLKNYYHIRKIKNLIKIKEETKYEIIDYPDNDEEINSALEKFLDILKEIESVYNTPLNLNHIVDLFFDGKKGENFSSSGIFENKDKIIYKFKKILKGFEKVIKNINYFYEREKK